MAEGGGDFGYEDPDLDHNLDNDDDLIDFDSDEEADTTRPFQPGTASTPYHGGEQHEMQTMMSEQSGLPSYDERTPTLSELERRFAALREDPRTGIIDTTHIDGNINPLSEEDKKKTNRKSEKINQGRLSKRKI